MWRVVVLRDDETINWYGEPQKLRPAIRRARKVRLDQDNRLRVEHDRTGISVYTVR